MLSTRRIPCSNVTAALLVVMSLLWLGRATGLMDLGTALSLAPASVLHGQLWRPFLAPLLASGLLDLIFGAAAIFWVSAEIERVWKPLEWLLYGALCVAITGFSVCALFPRAVVVPVGPALLTVALLVARVRLAPHERIHISQTVSISAVSAVLLWAGMILVTAMVSGMPLAGVLALFVSAATGWTYLTLRWFFLKRKPARAVSSNRFGRLEL